MAKVLKATNNNVGGQLLDPATGAAIIREIKSKNDMYDLLSPFRTVFLEYLTTPSAWMNTIEFPNTPRIRGA